MAIRVEDPGGRHLNVEARRASPCDVKHVSSLCVLLFHLPIYGETPDRVRLSREARVCKGGTSYSFLRIALSLDTPAGPENSSDLVVTCLRCLEIRGRCDYRTAGRLTAGRGASSAPGAVDPGCYGAATKGWWASRAGPRPAVGPVAPRSRAPRSRRHLVPGGRCLEAGTDPRDDRLPTSLSPPREWEFGAQEAMARNLDQSKRSTPSAGSPVSSATACTYQASCRRYAS